MACLLFIFFAYVYFAAFTPTFDVLLLIAIVSLGIEGVVVFVLNGGDCSLIHVQRTIGDDTPFFELLFPPGIAKKAIPVFALLTWDALALLITSAYLRAL
jgi:hypothetical protein